MRCTVCGLTSIPFNELRMLTTPRLLTRRTGDTLQRRPRHTRNVCSFNSDTVSSFSSNARRRDGTVHSTLTLPESIDGIQRSLLVD